MAGHRFGAEPLRLTPPQAAPDRERSRLVYMVYKTPVSSRKSPGKRVAISRVTDVLKSLIVNNKVGTSPSGFRGCRRCKQTLGRFVNQDRTPPSPTARTDRSADPFKFPPAEAQTSARRVAVNRATTLPKTAPENGRPARPLI